MSFISAQARIDPSALLGAEVTILGDVFIEAGVILENGVVVGQPQLEKLVESKRLHYVDSLTQAQELTPRQRTVIMQDCYIGRYSTIYVGAVLEKGVICMEYTLVGLSSTIGEGTKLMYGAQIHCRVNTGKCCRIGGFCCNDSYLGNYVSVYGQLLHVYRQFGGGRNEPAPVLEDYVMVGAGAQVIGEVRIGRSSYVTAGSVVTVDVPSYTVVTGVNHFTPIKNWKGELRETWPGKGI